MQEVKDVVRNATFETITRQHRELQSIIRELHEFLELPRPEVGAKGSHTWATALSERLIHFHDMLFRHFREEESSGMLSDLEREAPQAIHVVAALRTDHDRLLSDLRAVLVAAMTYAEGKCPENPQIRRWITAILDQLALHEQQETELMQRVYLEDLGSPG